MSTIRTQPTPRRTRTPASAMVRMDKFVSELQAAIEKAMAVDPGNPAVKRKFRTVVRACGYQKASSAFLRLLSQQLAAAGIHVTPALSEVQRPAQFIRLSHTPPAPVVHHFRSEADLASFMTACLGTGVFRRLEPFVPRGRSRHSEQVLPGRVRADMLCVERKRSGARELVVIELKRKLDRGAIQQLVEYMDAVGVKYRGRRVSGLIVSGEDSEVAREELRRHSRYRIDWYRYHVDFSLVGRSSVAGK